MCRLSTEQPRIIKVLVVDDHTLFAEGTVALLSSESRISVIGIAKDGMECMKLIRELTPDVVLLDIKLPDVNGIDLLDKINEIQPVPKIIMMTGYDPKGYITKSMNKGVKGFLLKDCTVNEMIQGILRVYDGENAYFPENHGMLREPLTHKEIEIMSLLSKGLHNKEIASILGIKVRTVEYHISNILPKLGVSKRFEAVLQWANINKDLSN